MSNGSSGTNVERGATRNARPRRDVTGMAAHDLDDHHTVVRLGRGVQAVDRFGRDFDCSDEAKGEIGALDVVVDGFGHPHHR